jgi:hypothetical protein
MKEVLHSKFVCEQNVAKHTLGTAVNLPHAVKQNRHKSRLEVRILNVLRTPEESYTDLDKLLTLCGGDDMRHVARDELEVANDVFNEVLRKTLECCRLLGGQR